jgi:hypothetical protein
MTRRFVPPTPEELRDLKELADRPLTAEEAEAYLVTTPEERAEMAALIDWFQRRYPSPADRMKYARRWTLRLRRTLPAGIAR